MDPSRMRTSRVVRDLYTPVKRVRRKAPIALASFAGAAVLPEPSLTPHTFSKPKHHNEPSAFDRLHDSKVGNIFEHAVEFIHKYSLGTFAILFFVVATAALQVAASYVNAKNEIAAPAALIGRQVQPVKGLNMHLPTAQLDTKIAQISAQGLTVRMGEATETIAPDTIRSWLKVVNDKASQTSYINVNQKAIIAHLQTLAANNSSAARNQVTVTHGTASTVILTGVNGTQVQDPTKFAKEIAKNLFAGKGFNGNIPTKTVPFAAATPANFDKLIEVNLASKQMFLWQNGSVVKQFPISAGRAEYPSPIGEFKIKSQLASDDMRGFNANGTRYFQPNVRWVSYFKEGGYAIHGNYWNSPSVFGVTNTSHGCIGLTDANSKEVFDWAPIGTTLIIH